MERRLHDESGRVARRCRSIFIGRVEIHGDCFRQSSRRPGNGGTATDARCAHRRLPLPRATRSRRGCANGCDPAQGAHDQPVAPPTRAPKPNSTSCEMQIAAGLRTSGLSRLGQFLVHAASQTPGWGSVPRHGSFPVTAAGQLRIRTGFPLRSSRCARHRNATQDIVFEGLRQLRSCGALSYCAVRLRQE
jgi:hypothetical protein